MLELGKKTIIFNAMLVPAAEFGLFLPKNDMEFLNVLNDVYDCNDIPIRDATQKHGVRQVDRPCMCLLAGTQPKYLSETLPETAYGMGFTRRIIMIYCGVQSKKELFGETTKTVELRNALIKDLISVAKLKGKFHWTPDAKEAAEDWHKHREEDEPKHSRLASYNTTRVIHCLKIAMVAAAASNNNMEVTLEDFMNAKNLLLEAERVMPEIFKEMVVSTDAVEMEEALEFVWKYTIKYDKSDIPESTLVNFLARRVPVTKVSYMLDLMIQANMIKLVSANIPGRRQFKPIRKDLQDMEE